MKVRKVEESSYCNCLHLRSPIIVLQTCGIYHGITTASGPSSYYSIFIIKSHAHTSVSIVHSLLI